MPNAASRVFLVLERARAVRRGEPISTFDGWYSLAAGATKAESEWRRDDEIVSFLRTLRSQIDLVETEVAASSQRSLMNAPIASARQFASLRMGNQPWKDTISGVLRAEIVTGWQWAGASLPEAEREVPIEELADIREAIDELEARAREAGITEEFRALILAQVAALRAALASYPVQGVQPLKDQLATAVGALMVGKPTLDESAKIAPEATETVWQRVKQVFGKVADACGKASDIKDGAQATLGVAKKCGPLLLAVFESWSKGH